MCGIAGEFAFEREQVTAAVSRMIAALRHRGPDSSGHYISPAKNVLLVNTRLAIVDVGDGTQPLTNEDGAVWITFNGEIYGFAALARQLERRGHRLRTRCDTEVIVHLYEEHGEAFVEHLRGEFAFALYDQRHHTLWLGRDRFGVKPLYYALSPKSLLFGSEIKAIFSNPVIKRALNPSFIYSYLHGLLPPDETAFVGVRQVEPGCLLRVTAAGVEPRRYWQPRFTATPAAADAPVTDRESVEEFRRLFADAVDLRLQGDQDPGVYLSGGLDSTAVATQAARLSSRPVKAFTVAFSDPDYDESARAAATGRCCMNTRCGWGGVARTSRDPPQEPHYGDEVEGPSQVQDEVSRGELGGLQSGPRSTRRCDGVGVLGSDRGLDGRPERPARRAGRYSDLAIETALTLRLLYHLPLRQAEGFLHALFGMMRLDLSAPDYTTLSRRSQHLRRRLRPIPPGEGLHLVLDSTGLSIVGAGEWAAAKHGGRGRRGWKKLHLGVDQSGVVRVHTLTEATDDDATTALDLLTAVEGPLVRVTADAAYDTVAVYERRCCMNTLWGWGRASWAGCGPDVRRGGHPEIDADHGIFGR